MNSYPKLSSERITLERIRSSDVPTIVKYASNIKVAETTLNMPHPYHEEDAIFWINMANQGFKNKTQFTFGVRLKSTDEIIGGIGLRVNSRFDHAEMGYWIAEPYWNKGYATEAVASILKFGFEQLDLHKIFAHYLVENIASGKVMIKNKMIKEGELKDHTKKDGKYRSLIQYRLLKSEYSKTI